jgi:hypothetical protein
MRQKIDRAVEELNRIAASELQGVGGSGKGLAATSAIVEQICFSRKPLYWFTPRRSIGPRGLTALARRRDNNESPFSCVSGGTVPVARRLAARQGNS